MSERNKKILLFSGIMAVIIYVLHVVIGGFLWKGYSHLHQPISDLTATGAPNKALLMIFTMIYGVLAIVFAVSFTIFESKKYHKFVFWGGVLFILLHIISVSYGFFPQDLPGATATYLGKMHIVVTAFIVPFTILTPFLIGFGFIKEPNWKTFGVYSIITGILILFFGGASGIFFAQKWPYFGLIERLNIGILQVWTFCFSYKLISKK
ncbi:MAG: hypothetical protein A2W99_07035 [Bacteroidetes bacterium GWF2_33_16]|nr:MAG: hypothetical protein A2X00_12305 [Bacteroidetes bacterium GWE2_32_14]OFY08323.1 MAG: hypothetical protein A2W99_07035 [Bacteroidetes bacterium GWF2_33_16]